MTRPVKRARDPGRLSDFFSTRAPTGYRTLTDPKEVVRAGDIVMLFPAPWGPARLYIGRTVESLTGYKVARSRGGRRGR